MVLSDGSPSSMTASPEPISLEIPAAKRAIARFAVHGNAVITGGAGGIGSVTCRALLEHGLEGLAIFDLFPEEAEKTVSSLKHQFPQATITFTKVDVTNPESVKDAMAKAEADLGSIDIVLCYAGIASSVHALEMSPVEWQKMFDVNTTGAFLIAQAAAQSMTKRMKGGSIILMASISGHFTNFPQPQVHYNATKAAILSMKSSLAGEWARYGIRVNSISPGYMDTILNEGAGLEEHRREWRKRNPFGRMGQPEELTGAAILLASKAGNYITGADILVDGGITRF